MTIVVNTFENMGIYNHPSDSKQNLSYALLLPIRQLASLRISFTSSIKIIIVLDEFLFGSNWSIFYNTAPSNCVKDT